MTHATQASPGLDQVRDQLTADFPDLAEDDIVAELVQAHDAVDYVGTPDGDRLELVEFMARYGLMVRTGQVTPSDRLDPEKHASPRRD